MGRLDSLLKAGRQHTYVARDFILNIIASVMLTAVTQLLVFPLLSRTFDADFYGVILTVMGIGNVLVTSIGNSVNNARLLMETDYLEKKYAGDFMPIITFGSIASSGIFLVYLLFSGNVNSWITALLLIVYVLLGNMRGYGVVAYRLTLNFRDNLICSFFISLGQAIGLLILVATHMETIWPIVFVIGELAAIPVLLVNTSIFMEPFHITPLVSKTIGKITILIFTALIANILIYLDRIMLLPILGGEAVSIYTTASFMGKCLGILLTPMAGVLLGYFAQSSFKMTKFKYRSINILVLIGAAAFFVICLLIAKPITGFLFPTLIERAIPYLVIANLTAIIGAVGNMTQPAVLKYAPLSFQIYIQLAYCAIYLGGGLYGAKTNGLMGFAIAALFASIARLIALFALGEKYIDGDIGNRD